MEVAEQENEMPRVKVEYANLDIPPRYVEGIHGVLTAQGGVHCNFYSDFITPHPDIEPELRRRTDQEGNLTVDMNVPDPYGIQKGEVRIVRRIEASVILSETAARALHSWLGQMIERLASRTSDTAEQAEAQ